MDLKEIFLNDLDWTMAGEILFRTVIMFLLVLVMLRLSGKKGVRQLSIFEVAIIIALGSAAGDPMFGENHAILPSVIVFTAILGLYRLITLLASKSEKFESMVEGDPVYIIEDGEFVLSESSDTTFAKDEFFAELRMQNVEHLGQIRVAILETNGNVSLIYYEDERVRPGLPVLPKPYNKREKLISGSSAYACTYCGHVEELSPGTHQCERCKKQEWVAAIDALRIN